MGKQRRRPQAESESDDSGSGSLGQLLGSYSTNTQVVGAWIGSAILALAGLIVVWKAEAIGKALEGHSYHIFGWILVGIAGCISAYALLMSGKEFKIYKKGVRYRSRRKVKTMLWEDIRDIVFTRIETINPQGHLSTVSVSWKVVLQSDEDSIVLSESFLTQTGNASGLMTQLKLNCKNMPREEFLGEGGGLGGSPEAALALDVETRGLMEMAKIAKERREKQQQEGDAKPQQRATMKLAGDSDTEEEPAPPESQPKPQKPASGGLDLPRSVAQKLKAGHSAQKIMAWLQQKHEMPKPVAEKILEKAMELLKD